MTLTPYLAEAGPIVAGGSGMSNIIAFKAEQRSRDRIRADDARGQILFFTGVRYVRDEAWDEASEDEASSLLPLPALVGSVESERLKA